MELWREIEIEMLGLRDEAQARHLMRFFKCGPGEYGEGDRFLGIRVPVTRTLIKKHRKDASLEDAVRLTQSPWHEIRLAGFLLMIEVYKKAKENGKRQIIDTYLSILDRGNNWDLVDVVCPKLLGDWIVRHPEEEGLLGELADMEGSLWHQRVAMVSNWMLIRKGNCAPAIRLAEKFLNHPHDLMHKASGWMLREVGKRNLPALLRFLNLHAADMPRTMLRYSIEKLDSTTRHRYMTITHPENLREDLALHLPSRLEIRKKSTACKP
ncbi:MAG: DNA alkylation repair protein [Muribaculaceae bacterium]|nr:DNA alkylation repair protein [Muribaculaceae bacterium]